MTTQLFWFRNDLRLHDQLALQAACSDGTRHLLPVYCLPAMTEISAWGFARFSTKRLAGLSSALQDLATQLERMQCPLLVCRGPATRTLPLLANAVGASGVVCENIAAPEEQAEVAALRAAGLTVRSVWQSSLLDPAQLPWSLDALPKTFSEFRRQLESLHIQPPQPLPTPSALPAWPAQVIIPPQLCSSATRLTNQNGVSDARSSLPLSAAHFDGGETAGLAHLAQYLARQLPHRYKKTRNDLSGVDYSSKWSLWLASGALSARRILTELRNFEAQQGANEGTYWLWFELLWRDYFRFLHLQYGIRLYHAGGISQRPRPAHHARKFEQWCQAQTGQPLIDAAMRELQETGYLSNRLRQVVASYLIYNLDCDWRAGAAWFESQLLDYDVYSNQGNWLYIAGRGSDPRGGRHFNVDTQTTQYDPSGAYRRLWGT